MSALLLRAGEWEQVTPESAGWRHLYFGVRKGSFASETGVVEIALVPLGGRCRVEAEGEQWELGGRASYVYDWKGGDGWITPKSYPAIEADGFAGSADGSITDAGRLAEDLRRYSASMGPVNLDLVMAHHKASEHAQGLVGLFRRLAAPSDRPAAPLQEMARLVRLEWRARADVHSLVHENAHLRGLLTESRQDAIAAHEEARKNAEEVSRQAAETARSYELTLSWRLTRPLRALLGARERRRARGRSGD